MIFSLLGGSIAQAATLTSGQISAIISMLQAFGADTSVVANVQAALSGQPTTGTNQATSNTNNCSAFTSFAIGSRGTSVSLLQQTLINAGDLNISAPTGYFGNLTLSAFKAWQATNNCDGTTTPTPTPVITTPIQTQIISTPVSTQVSNTPVVTPTLTPATPAQVVDFVSPAGGENFYEGATYNVQFTMNQPYQNEAMTSVSLYQGNILLGQIPYTPSNFSQSGNMNTLQWVLGSYGTSQTAPTGSNYILKVIEPGGVVVATSNPFNLLAKYGSTVTTNGFPMGITAPSDAITLTAGTTYDIKYYTSFAQGNEPEEGLKLYQNGTMTGNGAFIGYVGTPGTGSWIASDQGTAGSDDFKWNVGQYTTAAGALTTVPAGKYQLQAYFAGGMQVMSDTFSIQ